VGFRVGFLELAVFVVPVPLRPKTCGEAVGPRPLHPDLDILAVWIDGIQLGPHHVICAVGVDDKGHKHVLGLREGATENTLVARALLEDLVARSLDPAPKDQREQAKATLKAAFKLDTKEGMAKIKQYAIWLERDHPSAAASLREGLEEMFTIDRLGLPSKLRRCLGTTNLIDNGHSAARDRMRRLRTGRAARWRYGGRRPPSRPPQRGSAASWAMSISGC
jgi:transposase-like protein